MPLSIAHDVALKRLNSFGVDAQAACLLTLRTLADLPELLAQLSTLAAHARPLVLGGGSNLVLANPRIALVLQMALRGREIVEVRDDQVLVEAAAGENWHEFVMWSIDQQLSGLENLALIPGTVGAAPIQNIGAYGVELDQVFDSLEAINLRDGRRQRFDLAACEFGYRSSLFKSEQGRDWLILSVRIALSRGSQPRLQYGALQAAFSEHPGAPSPREIAAAVIQIRQSKLPDPVQIGNAGSFFKNPRVHLSELESLRRRWPDLPAYPAGDQHFKVAAAWLIENAGWKGYRRGDAGVHEHHALVLVNHGQATGAELLELAQDIRQSVVQRFGLELEIEPLIVLR